MCCCLHCGVAWCSCSVLPECQVCCLCVPCVYSVLHVSGGVALEQLVVERWPQVCCYCVAVVLHWNTACAAKCVR